MQSKNVVFFWQKRTTDKNATSYAVQKGDVWIINFWTTVLDSLILSFSAELFGQGRDIQTCCPFLLLT